MPVKSKGKARKGKTVKKTVKARSAKPKNVKKLASKAKPKPKVQAKAKATGKFVAKAKTFPAKAKAKAPARMIAKSAVVGRPMAATSVGYSTRPVPALRPLTSVVRKTSNPLIERRPVPPRTPRVHQFAYMKAPGMEHAFEVGDTVEVFCDHEKNRERVRGWVRGIVVQVDNKMVAVQFRSNVFLTDGWMVPDRILWYPVTSEHIRTVPGKKAAVKKDFIPDY
jgi:hypothetical protein